VLTVGLRVAEEEFKEELESLGLSKYRAEAYLEFALVVRSGRQDEHGRD
jgi:hypothetical protein